MRPQLQRVGTNESPVVIIDEFSGAAEDIGRIADFLAPFPPSQGNYYPGVRRKIGQADRQAYSYVVESCERAAPFIGGAFEVDGFDLGEASFSVVATPPNALGLLQRAPHFDATHEKLFALLHYLRVPPGTGTAFYRHRSTGIERVTEANRAQFLSVVTREMSALGEDSGYINGSNEFFEQIGRVDAVPDRLIIYYGNLLHSGIIPIDMPLSSDPSRGRLTANLFVIGR